MLPHVAAGLSQATLRRIELASGELAATCLAEMERRQPWFGRLPADQRAGVLLVTQTGVANFVAWLGERGESIRLTAEAFRIAPHDLAQRLSLRQTVDLVRIATDVFEHQLPPLAADESERHTLVEGILRFGREIAFAAATVYAGAAETRGAWDARQEALVVDAVVRGETDHALVSRASALGWDAAAALRVVVGSPASGPREGPGTLRREAGRAGRSVLVGVQGSRQVVLVSEPRLRRPFRSGWPWGSGPALSSSGRWRRTWRGRTPAPATRCPGCAPHPGGPPRPGPSRPTNCCPSGHSRATPWPAPGSSAPSHRCRRPRSCATHWRSTWRVAALLKACARALFVHPNTVRYRLRRVSEITQLDPADPRDALVLRTAVIVGRLDDH